VEPALDLEDYRPSELLHCWLGHLTCKIVSEMTYNVSSGTLNPTIPCRRSPVHNSNNVQVTLSNATSWTILSTMSNVASTLLPFLATMSNEIKFRPFDKVETHWTCSICFDFVERTKFYNRIVRDCCHLWQRSRMLLRQCCWCGRGLSSIFASSSHWATELRAVLLPQLRLVTCT